MNRRILLSTVAVVVVVAMLLGVPLLLSAWRIVEEFTREDMKVRLDQMATEVLSQQGQEGLIQGRLDTEPLRLVVPPGGRLEVIYPTPLDSASRASVGEQFVEQAIVESLSLGVSGSLRLEIPPDEMRAAQWQAIAVVGGLLILSIGAGSVVAQLTARRLSDPLSDVAARAARLGAGDFRPDPRRHGIPELDRVSEVLDAASVEIAERLQRERTLVGDVSHQLRSRLTAIRLRLDELAEHHDSYVVAEATEALGQVDRLSQAVDDLVRASRDHSLDDSAPLEVVEELGKLVSDWSAPFRKERRRVTLEGSPGVTARATASRLREAVSVLIDNSLRYGAGTCTIRVRNVRSSGDRREMVVVEVADEGQGIPDDIAPRIFERGFSGGGSSGVGLALARALVEADGGRMELQQRKPAVFALFVESGAEQRRERVVHSTGGEPR
ncbi:sensor histidine kinase [Hoyosella subflava]|uniref:Signal transduction histidine-protein kinase/phosphatase MprB n=1 Tax=Hoyosella subflava (strain DSM 45089 / JCM 17490 / NBRC 109087 / DQS3-9A1) TaxID=443218 RepID=F6EGM8_HOYSD|nr:HAMP domain-containing sensor histidine kinase [Hoyosella subflava]AEF42266.1 Sensor kinase, two-component system [Hoyosella subflava DQS3-9A1]